MQKVASSNVCFEYVILDKTQCGERQNRRNIDFFFVSALVSMRTPHSVHDW